MKGKKKALWLVLLMVLTIAMSVVFTACGDTNKDDGDDVETPATLQSIRIATPPTKIVYREGELFDATGVVVEAVYSDASVVVLDRNEYKYSPTATLAYTVEKVTFTYKGLSVDCPITVNWIEPLSIEITTLPTVKQPQGDIFDFAGLVVTAVIDEEGTKKTITDYTLSVDGTNVPNAGISLTKGSHTVTASYRGKSATFDVEVYNGYLIEAENFKRTADVTADDKNFVEVLGSTGIRAVSKAEEPASGGAYMGEIKVGNSMVFHIWSDVERTADIILTAASGYVTEDDGSGDWSVTVMGDMQLNRVIKVTINDEYELEISDDVILEGGVSTTEIDEKIVADWSLWVNWKDVVFGEMELKEGDNTIKIEIISDYRSKFGSTACNIDKLEVEFKD